MDKGVINELKKGVYHPLYVIYGEEEYIVSQILQTMQETMLHPDWEEMNFIQLDLLKVPLQEAVEAADTYPFGEGRRLVIGRNAFFLTGSTQRQNMEHSIEALLNYMENPPDFSSLVLIVPYEKLDERKKIVKQIVKQGTVIQVQPLKAEGWNEWVTKKVEEFGIPIDGEGIHYLHQRLPHDLRMVEHELEKLSLYGISLSPGEKITIGEIDLLISRTVESDVFALIDRVANQDFVQGYLIFSELMKQNEEPVKILALLARQFRIILQVKVLNQQGYSQKQIAGKLRLHPYPVKLALEQGRHFPDQDLYRILDTIAELDYQMKTGQIEKRLGIEMLLLQMKPSGKKKATL